MHSLQTQQVVRGLKISSKWKVSRRGVGAEYHMMQESRMVLGRCSFIWSLDVLSNVSKCIYFLFSLILVKFHKVEFINFSGFWIYLWDVRVLYKFLFFWFNFYIS